MLQSLATLIFTFAAIMAVLLIVASLSDEWQTVRWALGFGGRSEEAPRPPRVRVLQAQRVRMLRVTPGEMRRAA